MRTKQEPDQDGNIRRTVQLTLSVTLDMPLDATEDDIIAALDANDVSWSTTCELIDYGFES